MKVSYEKNDAEPEVHIDEFDVWDMCNTLAFIILPMLEKLKSIQHGTPVVCNNDVPEELHFDDSIPTWQQPTVDELKYCKRWDYILDEMIWAFRQYTIDDQAQFYRNSDNIKIIYNQHPGGGRSITFGKKDESKPGRSFDKEAAAKHEKRKANGLRLFAKYYNSLWD